MRWSNSTNQDKIKESNKKQNNNNQNKPGNDTTQKPHIIVPYHRGLSESCKKVCINHGVQVYFKGGTTIKNLLMAPKDQDSMQREVESSTDINVTGWSVMMNTLVNHPEHLERGSRTSQGPLPIFDHYNTSGHQVSIENFSIVGREEQNFMRAIKEALYIRVNNPSLNRNIGKYHLPHIWDEVLFNTSELKLK